MTTPTATCRSCGAEVYLLQNAKTGKLAPIDVEVTGGNVICDLDADPPTYEVLGSRQTSEFGRKSHFATCPQATTWRGR